jgi:hypothetical protein
VAAAAPSPRGACALCGAAPPAGRRVRAGWGWARGGCGFLPRGRPSRRPLPALPAPLPAASQLRAPGAGKKPHAPARNAGLPGGRRAAGGGRSGAGRSAPPGRWVRAQRARPCPASLVCAALATSPPLTLSPPDTQIGGPRGPRDCGRPGAGGGAARRARQPQSPPRAPRLRPRGSQEGAGRPVSPHPSPPPALGPGWGAGG